MRIQHNIMAMNAYRNYTTNVNAMKKNLEKLSSGYKINRAGDDAAGLAISEKMRAQITGLSAAQKNVKDGISLVQTAEGAMQEIHDMLNRMDYLATQSANGTYDNEVDRLNLQKEVTALKDEINRIADSANFNGIKLLDGSLAAQGGSAATSVGKIEGIDLIDVDATKATYEMGAALTSGATGSAAGDKFQAVISLTDSNGKAIKEITIEFTHNGTGFVDADGKTVDLSDKTKLGTALVNALKKDETIKANFNVSITGDKIKFEAKEGGASTMQVKAINLADITAAGVSTPVSNGIKATAGKDAYQALDLKSIKIYGDGTGANGTDKLKEATFSINGKKFALVDRRKLTDEMKAELKAAGIDHFLDITEDDWTKATIADIADLEHKIGMETGLTTLSGTVANGVMTAGDAATDLHIGLMAGTSKIAGGGLTLQIGDTADSFNQLRVSVGDMHCKALGIANLDISNQDGAAAAIQQIKDAINTVSGVRGDLGAIQNRLEHTQNNLSVMKENIQDAESSIRDTDVADEMMAYTKNNILIQSAQAMLAQANQIPQGVLQLLQ